MAIRDVERFESRRAVGEFSEPKPALLIMAAFSAQRAVLERALSWASETWGEPVLECAAYVFDETDYYQRQMGGPLIKTAWAFREPIDPEELVDIKHLTNEWEEREAARATGGPPRPVNLDPGYVTEAKLVLATTKDRDHRIYLRRGVFAEVTLHYHGGAWRCRPWTYRDYQRENVHAFVDQCRTFLRRRLAES